MIEVGLEIDAGTIQIVANNIEEFFRRVVDPTAYGEVFKKIIFQANSEQILSQGERSSEPYDPLSPGYAREKEKKYPGQPILIASRDLFNALTGEKGSASEPQINDESLIFTFSEPFYIGFHQSGTRFMPARPPIALIQTDAEAMAELIVLHAEQLLEILVTPE